MDQKCKVFHCSINAVQLAKDAQPGTEASAMVQAHAPAAWWSYAVRMVFFNYGRRALPGALGRRPRLGSCVGTTVDTPLLDLF